MRLLCVGSQDGSSDNEMEDAMRDMDDGDGDNEPDADADVDQDQDQDDGVEACPVCDRSAVEHYAMLTASFVEQADGLQEDIADDGEALGA